MSQNMPAIIQIGLQQEECKIYIKRNKLDNMENQE